MCSKPICWKSPSAAGLAYNLALATWLALTGTAAYALASNVVRPALTVRASRIAGGVALAATVLLGNLDLPRTLAGNVAAAGEAAVATQPAASAVWRAALTRQAERVLALLRATRAAICTRDVLVAFLLGGAIHLIAIFAVLLLARAFGFELHYRDLLTLTAAAIFVSMLPVSFNGWGVREGALMLGLSLLAVPREIALLIAFLYGAGGALASLPGSLSWRRLRAPADGTGQDSRSA